MLFGFGKKMVGTGMEIAELEVLVSAGSFSWSSWRPQVSMMAMVCSEINKRWKLE